MERPHSVHIAGTSPPPPLTWGGLVPKTLLERGGNPEKGGGDRKMEKWEVLLHLLCVEGKSKVSFITF